MSSCPGTCGSTGRRLPSIHQIPHGRDRFDTAALVGDLGVVGDEVKFPAPMAEAALLDFMACSRKTRLDDM